MVNDSRPSNRILVSTQGTDEQGLSATRLFGILEGATQSEGRSERYGSAPMDDDVRREFEAQAAQILALETVLFCLLCELQRSEQLSNAALNSLFDQA